MKDSVGKALSTVVLTLLLTACGERDADSSTNGDLLFTGGSTGGISGPGETTSGGEADTYEIRSTDSVFPYRASSPYGSVLKQCILIGTVAESCSLTTLPFIGDGVNQPSIDQIMDRVLVTHNWMGERFEAVIRTAPDDLLNMFSSATAILIGSDVRPSFYTALTGAIQIDPIYLWSSINEKGSISTQEDFRSEFGADLQFWFLRRIAASDGRSLWPYYSLEDASVRPFDDLRLPLIRLLFHELAHATDFMPRTQIGALDTSLSAYNAITSIADQWLSPALASQFPLQSEALESFGQVLYQGETATSAQNAATPAQLGQFMATDGAIQLYSYSTIREDLAQLVEGVVMAYYYDSIVNVGFTNKPVDDTNYTCNDLLVGWGQRNRLADPLVNPRARLATDLVVNMSPDMIDYLDNTLSDGELMTQGVHWCDNQTPAVIAASHPDTRSSERAKSAESAELFREKIRVESPVHTQGIQ